jgi:FOG: LysM repeat
VAASGGSGGGRGAGKPENGRYLIGLLKEKEERYARLTMCIVHRNDTLAAIAARYGVSADTIRTVNGMADDHLEEGQILLIPRREG